MTRYAHALSSHTPKDTLLTLNTLPESSHDDSLLVLGLVLRHLPCIPSAHLAAHWYGDALPMRITQSISLSNIQTLSFYREGPPWGGKNLPMLLACFQIGVTTIRWQRSGNSE